MEGSLFRVQVFGYPTPQTLPLKNLGFRLLAPDTLLRALGL